MSASPAAAPASPTITWPVTVTFGDCDPAGIVFYPRFLHWMDASSLNFFMSCGVPPWRELVKTRGIVGTPMLELLNVKFVKTATYGERIEVHTCVTEWREKVFVMRHTVRRGDTLLCEGSEVRGFIRRDETDPDRIRLIPIPADILAQCQAPGASAGAGQAR